MVKNNSDNILMTFIIIALLVVLGMYAGNYLTSNTSSKVFYDFTDMQFNTNNTALTDDGYGITFSNAIASDLTFSNLSFANNIKNQEINFSNIEEAKIRLQLKYDVDANETYTSKFYTSFEKNAVFTSYNGYSPTGMEVALNYPSLSSDFGVVYQGVNWFYRDLVPNNQTITLAMTLNFEGDYALIEIEEIPNSLQFSRLSEEFVNGVTLEDFTFSIEDLVNTTGNTSLTITELSLEYNELAN